MQSLRSTSCYKNGVYGTTLIKNAAGWFKQPPVIGGLFLDYFTCSRLSFAVLLLAACCVYAAIFKPSLYILPEIFSFSVPLPPPHFTSPSAPHCTEKWLAVFDFAMWVGHACFGSGSKCKSMRPRIQKETNWICSACLNLTLNIWEIVYVIWWMWFVTLLEDLRLNTLL